MLAEEYKDIRRALRLTQGELAAALKCSRYTIEDREQGKARVTAKAELALLRFMAARMIFRPLSSKPAPKAKPRPRRAFPQRRKTAPPAVTAAVVNVASTARKTALAPPPTCAAGICGRPATGPNSRYCAEHARAARAQGLPLTR